MYSATEQGEIVSYYKNKRTVLKGFFNKKTGYRKVQIMIDGKMKDYLVHVLVAEAFAGRLLKTNQCTHHQDHNSSNNKPSNLCIMTIEQHLKLHADEKKGTSLSTQFTSWSTSPEVYASWVQDVAVNGTFYKSSSLNEEYDGANRIPIGWTVVNI